MTVIAATGVERGGWRREARVHEEIEQVCAAPSALEGAHDLQTAFTSC